MLKSTLPLFLAMLSADASGLMWLLGTLAALLALGIGLVLWIRRYVERCIQQKAHKLGSVRSAVIVAGRAKRRP